MTETPLRQHLREIGLSAEKFAELHSLSPWSVRHWSRGDKEPSLASQVELEAATNGEVSPADWLAWKLSITPHSPTPARAPERAA